MPDYEVTVYNAPDSLIASGWGMIRWRDWCLKTMDKIQRDGETLSIKTDSAGRIAIVSDKDPGAKVVYQFRRSPEGPRVQDVEEET